MEKKTETTEAIHDIIGDGDLDGILDDLRNADSGDTYVHKFSRPVSYDGATYTELTFEFGNLTGGDSLAVEAELAALNKPVFVRSIDSQYLIRICARACTEKVGSDIFNNMPIKDYTKITNAAKRFL